MNSLFTLQMEFIKTHGSVELDIGITKDSTIFEMRHRKVPVCTKYVVSDKQLKDMNTGYGETIKEIWQKMYEDILRSAETMPEARVTSNIV